MAPQGSAGVAELKCTVCDLKLNTAKALREHVAQHKWGPHREVLEDNTIKFQCLFENCGKILRDRKVLRKHCLTHRPREFECQECGKRFYERTKLKRHNLVHTGEKDFICLFPGCNKRFAYKANLRTHLRTHTGHRPYKCSWPGCQKSFAQASNRNSHVLTHTHNKRKREDSVDTVLSTPQVVPLKARKVLSASAENSMMVGIPSFNSLGMSQAVHLSPSYASPLASARPTNDLAISPANRDTISSLLSLRNGYGTNTGLKGEERVTELPGASRASKSLVNTSSLSASRATDKSNLSLGALAGILSSRVQYSTIQKPQHSQPRSQTQSDTSRESIVQMPRALLTSPPSSPVLNQSLPWSPMQNLSRQSQFFLQPLLGSQQGPHNNPRSPMFLQGMPMFRPSDVFGKPSTVSLDT